MNYSSHSCYWQSYISQSDQSYASQAYVKQTYASQTYVSQSYASQSYVSPSYASQSYASQSYASQSYASPSYASPSYISQSSISQSYNSLYYHCGHNRGESQLRCQNIFGLFTADSFVVFTLTFYTYMCLDICIYIYELFFSQLSQAVLRQPALPLLPQPW